MKLELKKDLNTNLLIVDDNQSIHDDFRKTLVSPGEQKTLSVKELEDVLFNNGEKEIQPDAGLDLTHLQYNIFDAFQGEEAIDLVRQRENVGGQFALIFMDVRMPPGINGIKAISRIWEINPYIEVVICTAYSDYSWDDIVARLGNTDKLLFLKKPFAPVEVKQMAHSLIIKWNLNAQNRHLIENLENEVKARTQQLEELYIELEVANRVLEEKNRMLEELAQRDALTGLFNHVALNERLRSAINQAQRHQFPVSVVMVDIDYFKNFNDTYGHQMGDEVIRRVSARLQENLRDYDVKLRYTEIEKETEEPEHTPSPSDDPRSSNAEAADPEGSGFAGRYGGDEFILILPYCGYQETVTLLKRLQSEIRAIEVDGYSDIGVTASIGAGVLTDPADCEDFNDLIKLADQALYHVKKSGRDQVHVMEFDKNALDDGPLNPRST